VLCAITCSTPSTLHLLEFVHLMLLVKAIGMQGMEPCGLLRSGGGQYKRKQVCVSTSVF
jgi:hypothetical protein